ncbi:MAG: hypothetical protein HOV80_06850 [Polyangiaceae bacterium]|nr:hypothetical protein [Polyangiaceae bacterium]
MTVANEPTVALNDVRAGRDVIVIAGSLKRRRSVLAGVGVVVLVLILILVGAPATLAAFAVLAGLLGHHTIVAHHQAVEQGCTGLCDAWQKTRTRVAVVEPFLSRALMLLLVGAGGTMFAVGVREITSFSTQPPSLVCPGGEPGDQPSPGNPGKPTTAVGPSAGARGGSTSGGAGGSHGGGTGRGDATTSTRSTTSTSRPGEGSMTSTSAGPSTTSGSVRDDLPDASSAR